MDYDSESDVLDTDATIDHDSDYDRGPLTAFDDLDNLVHRNTAEGARRVKIIIKDSSDTRGRGMAFQLRYLDYFKNALDHFKAASCQKCKPAGEMRFKTATKKIYSTSTPKKLNLKHNSTTLIHAYSTIPGLNCSACKRSGYPKTATTIMPGTPVPKPSITMPPPPKGKPMTLLVGDQTGFEMSVKTSSTMPLSVVMETYARQSLRDLGHLRFFFDGERMMSEETPKQLGLVQDDRIDVFIEQLGG